MANNESVLKPCFIGIGALGIVGNGSGLLSCLDWMMWSPLFGTINTLLALAGLVISVGYLMCGLKLDDYLPSKATQVEQMIQANIGLICLSVLLTLIIGHWGVFTLISAAIGIGVSIYLLKLVKG